MEKNQNLKLIIISLLIAMFLLVSQSYLLTNKDVEDNILTVSGKSEIKTTADQALLYIDIITNNKDVKLAQEENKKISNQVILALENKGILKKDIQTSNFRIDEYYNSDFYYRNSDLKIEKSKEEKEYKAVHSLKIKITDFSLVGEIVDLVVANGANSIDRVEYTLSDDKEKQIREQALDKAIFVGKQKADFMAEKLDVKILGVKTVNENNYYFRSYSDSNLKANVLSDSNVKSENYLAPKQVVVQSSVNLVFKIN